LAVYLAAALLGRGLRTKTAEDTP